MAWLSKLPQVSDNFQLYTLGQNKSVLLVGLGNIGKEYASTRHNVGFICLDKFVTSTQEMSDWINKKDLKCHLSSGRLGDTQVIAIKPTTMMNLSGQAVQAIGNFYKIANAQTLVIHDELDIPFGQIRMREGGSSAGHNGIKSISGAIGDNYGRIRIGIGPKIPSQIDSADFVLQNFSKKEQSQLPNMTKEVTAILTEYIYSVQLPIDTRSFIV